MCGESEMTKREQRKRVNLGNIFDRHVKHEFVDHDVDATMKTMVKEPIVHHVTTMTGGIGFDQVYNFYKTEFIGKMPNDTKLKRISRTIGNDQVVDELILCFTHNTEIPYMLAGIAPTGKYVEIPHVVVVKFKGNRIVHEHIYWDQASVLAQIGLLDCTNLPIIGIAQSRKLQEISSPKKK